VILNNEGDYAKKRYTCMHTTTIHHTYLDKVKAKLSLCLTKHHAMKTYWGSVDIAPCILWLRYWMEMSGQLPTPVTLPPGKQPL